MCCKKTWQPCKNLSTVKANGYTRHWLTGFVGKHSRAGLPDFSAYLIPKPEKCRYKWTQNVPNGHKISQMSVKDSKMSIKYSNILLFQGLKTLPKLRFLVFKINHLATLLARVHTQHRKPQ
jgi:hypothetical protein